MKALSADHLRFGSYRDENSSPRWSVRQDYPSGREPSFRQPTQFPWNSLKYLTSRFWELILCCILMACQMHWQS